MTNSQKIELEPFRITKSGYVQLASAAMRKKFKLLTIIVFTTSTISMILVLASLVFGIFWPLFAKLLLGIVLLITVWAILIWGVPALHANLNINRHSFQTYDYSIEDGHIIVSREDGAYSKYPLNKIVKISTILDCYILSANMYQSFLFPRNSFKSKEDLEEFEKQIKDIRKLTVNLQL